jgi:ADP-ribose pyrophosphatase YjhB (NUDIX family)
MHPQDVDVVQTTILVQADAKLTPYPYSDVGRDDHETISFDQLTPSFAVVLDAITSHFSYPQSFVDEPFFPMSFCLRCGHATRFEIPAGDQRQRIVCTRCDYIHYENPKIICGALAIWQDKILLCRRAIEPRYGFWTLPAGFMEIGETLEAGAARETWEEAEGRVIKPQLYCIYNIPRIGQVYMLFLCELADGVFGAGEESLECALFAEDEIPWGELAFPSIDLTLKHYFQDRRNGHYPQHLDTIGPADSTLP